MTIEMSTIRLIVVIGALICLGFGLPRMLKKKSGGTTLTTVGLVLTMVQLLMC